MNGAHVGQIDRSSFNIASRDLIQIEHRYDNCIAGAGHGKTLGAPNESEETQRGSGLYIEVHYHVF